MPNKQQLVDLRRRKSSSPQLCNLALVCQAEERKENGGPTQSEGTYPVTSLVDWRQAGRGGRKTVGEIGRKAECAWREQQGMIKDNKKVKKGLGQKGKTEIRN